MKEKEANGEMQIKGILDNELYKKHIENLKEKRKTIKRGENVVHIDYYGGILTDADLNEFTLDLEKNKLELSSFDKNGVMYASIEDYTNMVYVALNSELTKNILYAAAGNVVWESIKLVTKKVFSKTTNRYINKYQGNKIKKNEVTFGINITLDKNTGFKFRLDTKFTTENIDKPLNQAKEFVETQKPNEEYTHDCFLYYDHTNKKWIPVDMMEDINIKLLKSENIKKKVKKTNGWKKKNKAKLKKK